MWLLSRRMWCWQLFIKLSCQSRMWSIWNTWQTKLPTRGVLLQIRVNILQSPLVISISCSCLLRFCGSIPEYCDIDQGCQKDFGGCGDVKRPLCNKNGGSVDSINIGYYESWANTRKCSSVSPEDLNLDGFTHLNFAFVFFNPTTFEIVPMDKNAGELLSRFTKLKERKSGLQTWVSVGGWSFNDRKSISFIVNVYG